MAMMSSTPVRSIEVVESVGPGAVLSDKWELIQAIGKGKAPNSAPLSLSYSPYPPLSHFLARAALA